MVRRTKTRHLVLITCQDLLPVCRPSPIALSMNSPTPRSRTSGWQRFWIAVLVIFVLGPVLLAGAITLTVLNALYVGSDTAALRAVVAPSLANGWHKEAEVHVGWFPLALARTALRFAPVEPEVRQALRALRNAEVSVHARHADGRSTDRGAMLIDADRVMSARGWERLVGVVDRHDLVLVYLPKDLSYAHDIEACVLVLEPRHLVVVSARADLEPLLELARGRPEWQEGHRRLQVAAAADR